MQFYNVMLNVVTKESTIVGTNWNIYYVVMVIQMCLKIHSQVI